MYSTEWNGTERNQGLKYGAHARNNQNKLLNIAVRATHVSSHVWINLLMALIVFRVYSPFSGVTSNQAEGFNHVLKSLQEWKEAPLDCMVLSLYYLQMFYLCEIERGKQGLGEYKLHPQFSS